MSTENYSKSPNNIFNLTDDQIAFYYDKYVEKFVDNNKIAYKEYKPRYLGDNNHVRDGVVEDATVIYRILTKQ